jgi:hypothetical protein
MAVTAEDIVKELLGAKDLQIAVLKATISQLQETITQLKEDQLSAKVESTQKGLVAE